MKLVPPVLHLALLLATSAAQAQTLAGKFSCSAQREVEGNKVLLADTGEVRIVDGKLAAFRWESSLHRSTHGFDCSVGLEDGLTAEKLEHGWRIATKDAKRARARRGYDWEVAGQCAFRLEQEGQLVKLNPSCAALCGSRSNFSALLLDLEKGSCSYQE